MSDMNTSKERLEGETSKAKGKVKEGAGKLTGNHRMEAEGKGDQLKGKAQVAASDLKEKASDVADKVKDKARN